MPLLMPELQNALVDPLPEVRATAAHALGSLLRGMGEQHFQGLMPWLLSTLKSEVYYHASHIALCTSITYPTTDHDLVHVTCLWTLHNVKALLRWGCQSNGSYS